MPRSFRSPPGSQVNHPERCRKQPARRGNVSRQIVDVIPPSFPADKLVVIEVYTPGGNWSSYPPHKHDTHNPPGEVDLDEIYYYRIAQPEGFAFQHLYGGEHAGERTLKAQDGDVVLVHSGYHAVVAGPGIRRLLPKFSGGFLAGGSGHGGPQHAWIRSTWKAVGSSVAACAQSDPNSRKGAGGILSEQG